ncbi:hypothetical protein O181_076961 [Austropuccinia psidii MF-1]|uniref:Uncharacterized protein n=1 Tax=Austropuccinia psidii MF-1 TaxID=1389203 RepID=A0A9Q3FH78_9BASI|nr:hypothetical protein [Austropuccinia psidii MF-1]
MTNACDAFQRAHQKCLFVVQPFQPRGQRSSHPRCPRKDSFVVNNGERTFKLGPIVTHGIQMPKTKPTESPQQDSPVPQPSRHDEPPIPGSSPTSKPPEDILTREPEPELPPMQSTEEPFGKSSLLFLYSYQLFLTPPLTISSLSRYSLLCNHHQQYARWIPPSASKNPTTTSPHSHNDARQEFTNLQPSLMIPQAIVHKSINQILLEHGCLLHMIPFLDATH